MWLYKDKPIKEEDIPAKAIGFLYKITYKPTGKWYIGRKMLTKVKTTQLKGKKTKSKVDSGWADYWSSSPDLVAFIAEQGEANFTREILMFADTKACMTLGEEYLLHVSGSMFDDKCFNQNIRAKIYKKWFNKTPFFFAQLKAVKY
jgi:hypothetical protein